MNWEEALREVLNDFAEKAHCWGFSDCIQFVSAYVQKRTGIDHAAKFEYDTEMSALRLMAQYGGVEGLITHCLGQPKEPEVGDVVVCHVENALIPGVTNGSEVWMFTDKGLSRTVSSSIVGAWSCRKQ